MTVRRIFFVTQESLDVWGFIGGELSPLQSFTGDDTGFTEFEAYLAQHADQSSAMLLDVVEEDFALETIPKLGIRDRNALIVRRAQRKFRRTPFRVSLFQGKSARNSDECNVLHSAISNHELIEPWLRTILSHRVPLTGIYSVPLLAPKLFKSLFASGYPAMFIAPHQGTKLRQVFLQDGHLRSARLSQLPDDVDSSYAQFVVTEALRSRRYLERTRMLGAHERLCVCIVADADTERQITALLGDDKLNRFLFVNPETVARKVGRQRVVECAHFERVYLSMMMRRRAQHSYAASGENKYWYMARLQKFLSGFAVVTAAACSVAAGLFFSDAWMIRNRVVDIQAQVEQLSETFRRENNSFDPIKAGSYEMKLAVDTGNYILANRVPVPWVMNQLGAVLANYPDINVRELRWLAAPLPTEERAPQNRPDMPTPVAIPMISTVSAVLTAELMPFDGSLKSAFARIDALAKDLKAQTNFSEAVAIEYPFDARTSAAVSGEFSRLQTASPALFRLRVTYNVPRANGAEQENLNESI